MEFLVNVVQVRANGEDTDAEFLGDRFVAMPLGEEGEDDIFACGQLLKHLLLLGAVLKGVNHQAGNGAGHR